MRDVRNEREMCQERKTEKWILKRRSIEKRKMKDKVKINENKIYIKWVITGCLCLSDGVISLWEEIKMHSSGIKNQQSWVGNALELPWGSTVPGASLSSTITRSGVWVPFLQSRGMGFHTDCYLWVWKAKLVHRSRASWACSSRDSLLRVFWILWDVGKPSWNQNRNLYNLSDHRSQVRDSGWKTDHDICCQSTEQ